MLINKQIINKWLKQILEKTDIKIMFKKQTYLLVHPSIPEAL